MVATKRCAWGECKNDTRYPHLLKRNKNNDPVKFYHFPGPVRSAERRRKWIIACHRGDNFVCTKDSYVCSLHFVGSSGPTKENPDPISAVASTEKARRFERKRRSPIKRVLKAPPKKRRAFEKEVAAALLDLAKKASIERSSDDLSLAESLLSLGEERIDGENVNETTAKNSSLSEDLNIDDFMKSSAVRCSSPIQTTKHVATQTNIELADIAAYKDVVLKDCKRLRRQLFMALMDDPKNTYHYTGLTKESIKLVYGHLKSKAKKLKLWKGPQRTVGRKNSRLKKIQVQQKAAYSALSIKEQMVMTLVRLKRSPTLFMLANQFGISTAACSRIVTTWILFLAKELKFLLPFSTLSEMEGLRRPKVFRPYPNLRAVLDCTEFYIEKPSRPSSQRQTYSGYKSGNTFKLLVSLSPICHINFISKLYTGSISDKSIVQKSGFLDALQSGDAVMTDKGFNIQDILALQHVYLLAPPIMTKNNISPKATTLTRRIARARVHVERMIRKLKLFRILRSPIPLTIKPYIDPVVTVCAALVNLQPTIIKEQD